MEPQNQRALLPFLKELKERFPQKTIWCYSGYTLEELTINSRARCEVPDQRLALSDILVDGEFVEELKDISLRFRGSANQRLIDLKTTLKKGEVVLWDGK